MLRYVSGQNHTKSYLPSNILESSSSSKRLPAGSHKLTRKRVNTSDIPVIDLTTDNDVPRGRSTDTGRHGISTCYVDHGDNTCICEMCNAMLWRAESVRSKKSGRPNCFNFCCGGGKVLLPKYKEPPELLLNLYTKHDANSKNFQKNIRRYNMMFAFTSMGGKVDHSINKGNAPYVYRLHGQNYHSIGSLLPPNGQNAKFAQLYIYDTDNEVQNRSNAVRKDRSNCTDNDTDHQIIKDLKELLDVNNTLVKIYRMFRDRYNSNDYNNVSLRLIARRDRDGRNYNLPTASEVAALIYGDISSLHDKRDVIVETQSGRLKRIHELHPSYLALQYPLLFPFGEDGYSVDILHRDVLDATTSKRATCTMREFFAYRIQDRCNSFSLILNSRRLFQQFLVDGYTMIESERLGFIRNQQKILRVQSYKSLSTSLEQGNMDASTTGKRVILPSSFTGGARYMQQNYLDAMALCKWFGYPDLFLTLTCNPKWPEIVRFLEGKNLRPEDRPDILCRLFKIKLDELIQDIKKNQVFGVVRAVVYTIEFQKRGLPHSHICVFLNSDCKIPTSEHIDPIICAEIPDKDEDPDLYKLVSEFMIHGPCGVDNPKCPCTVNGKCTKKFPKKFVDRTSVDDNGFPMYRRRDNGNFVQKGQIQLDNRYVVPYNKFLLKRYQAHLNIEWCNQAGSIKYLFKYINKGPDRVTIVFDSDDADKDPINVDEIKRFQDFRYISACESAWRIFSFDVHYRYPSVTRLPFHLPNEQQVYYEPDDQLEDILNKPSVASTMFLSWMECNKMYPEARELSYVEFPTKFVWKANKKSWYPRTKGFSVGRINYCPVSVGDAYYLRVLLNKVKGPTSFEEIRTVNGTIHPTFRDACYAIGLLDDDKEYIEAIEEASTYENAHYVRYLFAMLLLSDSVSRPTYLWEQTWNRMSDDIIYNRRKLYNRPALSLNEDQVKDLTLFEVEKIMNRLGSTLRRFEGMPYPDGQLIASSTNQLIWDELLYDKEVLALEHNQQLASLTDEQRNVYEQVMNAVDADDGGVFFVYGYGGTGKTFIWKTLSAAIRCKGEIVLNVASSGIASLLLSGGRTAHSRFRIPINLHEDSICSINAGSDDAMLLKKAKLIIWDEAPMVHKHAFEALDRTLKDILSTNDPKFTDKPFGGKVIVFGGDFRQILPVIPKGNRNDIVNASLNSSYIWQHCRVLRLTVNMRLKVGSQFSDLEETKEFAEWILNIGEGKAGGDNDGEVDVEMPDDLLIKDISDPVGSIIHFTYPDVLLNFKNPSYFQERAILAPTHEVVDIINNRLLESFEGDEKVYLSSDSVCESEFVNNNFEEALYSPDVLNGLKFAGVPNHKLVLKVGVPIMLLRNIDQSGGLCNGTRLQVVKLGQRIIEAEIISGSNIGSRTFIPRMRLSPTDKSIPFKLFRRQFPVAVCFAMTINKSQGQSLSRVGLFLPRPVFSHGQLYVALSRVKSKRGLKVLITDKDGALMTKTSNVVYKEVLANL